MTNPRADDLYERLGIDQSAEQGEVKRAFVVAVKLHPPEKDPDNYKLIREAFDTLTNQQSRDEYDSRSQYGPEIESLEEELANARKDEDSVRQIRILKKLIILASGVGLYRNSLGLAYMDKEDHDAAAVQFEKATEIDPRNPTYLLNLGHANEAQKHFQIAEKYFKDAWDLDPEDYAAPRALASLLFYNLERKREAHSVLDQAILADDKVDFQDFFCMHDKIFFYVLDRDESGIDTEIERISQVAQSKDDREFAAYTFGHMAFQLMEWGGFRMANKLAEAALLFKPNDEALLDVRNDSKRISDIDRQLDTILARKDFPDFLKALLATMWEVYVGRGDTSEAEDRNTELFKTLPIVLSASPHNSDIKQAVGVIRKSYSAVYHWQDRVFVEIARAPGPEYFMLMCGNCKNEARAPIEARHDASGLSCPKCSSSGPFFTKGGSFSNGDLSSVPQSHSSGGGGSCYIATAAYGSYDHPDVIQLRIFRDRVLARSQGGKAFIRFYYRVGPSLARSVWASKSVARLVRISFLEPFAEMIRRRLT